MNQHKVLIVLVLYKINLEHSIAYQSLCQFWSEFADYQLLIYNNTIENPVAENEKYMVINAKSNEMLAGAYNAALEVAAIKNIEWLLLLDQDTQITIDFLFKIREFLFSNQDYVAAVPLLQQESQTLSPIRYNPTWGALWHKPALLDSKNTAHSCVSAFNSATLLQVSFMKNIGGFSNKYPLDYLDYWYFYEIFKHKKKVYVLDTTLQHTLSLIDFSESMTLERYKNFLQAERAFNNEQGIMVRILYKIRLMMRLSKQLYSIGMRKHTKLTLNYLLRV